MWGWKKREEIGRLEEKYMKWILGVEKTAPGYIVMEELKRTERTKAMMERAMRWKERLRREKGD